MAVSRYGPASRHESLARGKCTRYKGPSTARVRRNYAGRARPSHIYFNFRITNSPALMIPLVGFHLALSRGYSAKVTVVLFSRGTCDFWGLTTSSMLRDAQLSSSSGCSDPFLNINLIPSNQLFPSYRRESTLTQPYSLTVSISDRHIDLERDMNSPNL